MRAAKVEQAQTAGRLRGQIPRPSLDIVRLVRRNFPERENPRPRTQSHPPDGIARSRHRGAGPRTFASSVELAKLVLADLGEDAERIDRLVATFVAHDQEMLDKAQAVFRDEDKLIALSKTSRAELYQHPARRCRGGWPQRQSAPEQQAEKEIAVRHKRLEWGG